MLHCTRRRHYRFPANVHIATSPKHATAKIAQQTACCQFSTIIDDAFEGAASAELRSGGPQYYDAPSGPRNLKNPVSNFCI